MHIISHPHVTATRFQNFKLDANLDLVQVGNENTHGLFINDLIIKDTQNQLFQLGFLL